MEVLSSSRAREKTRVLFDTDRHRQTYITYADHQTGCCRHSYRFAAAELYSNHTKLIVSSHFKAFWGRFSRGKRARTPPHSCGSGSLSLQLPWLEQAQMWPLHDSSVASTLPKPRRKSNGDVKFRFGFCRSNHNR
eukprot:3647468-Amphidinium_carterae.1